MCTRILTNPSDMAENHYRHVLRESFRDNGKVEHRTLANLTHCSQEEARALKLAPKRRDYLASLAGISQIDLKQGNKDRLQRGPVLR